MSDLISKRAVILELVRLRDALGDPMAREGVEMALSRLEGLHPATGQRWELRWRDDVSRGLRCPACGVIAMQPREQETPSCCPHCGVALADPQP